MKKGRRVKVVPEPTPSKLDVKFLTSTSLPPEKAYGVELLTSGYTKRGFLRAVRHAVARGEYKLDKYLHLS